MTNRPRHTVLRVSPANKIGSRVAPVGITGSAGCRVRYPRVMLTMGAVVIRVDDFDRQRRFWRAALGYTERLLRPDDFVVLEPPAGPGVALCLDRWAAPVSVPPRIHLDLYADDQRAEIDRLVGLGASEVEWDGYPGDADYVVLADPEGNRFCVIDTSGSSDS